MRISTLVYRQLNKLLSLIKLGLFTAVLFSPSGWSFDGHIDYQYIELWRLLNITQLAVNNPSTHSKEERLVIVKNILSVFEYSLTPSDPFNQKKSAITPEIVGIGSTTTGFKLPILLPGRHIRRLAGFDNVTAAKEHIKLIDEYRERLLEVHIYTTPTELFPIADLKGNGVVYVLQPLLARNELAMGWLKDMYHIPNESVLIKTSRIKAYFSKQFDIAKRIVAHNRKNPHRQITADVVTNNWQIVRSSEDYDLWLNDVAQPLFKDESQKQVYQFWDIASYLAWPVSYLAQGTLVNEMSELYHPRNLMMQMLWGYEYFGGVPDDALDSVNSFLDSEKYTPITHQEIQTEFEMDQWLLACFYKYRRYSLNFRWFMSHFHLANDSVHMSIA